MTIFDPESLICFYDFQVSPASFDFFTFLISAEICRVRRDLKNIELVLVQGPAQKYRGDGIRDLNTNENYFHNVIVPGISLMPSVEAFYWASRDKLDMQTLAPVNVFPRGYSLELPVAEYTSHELVAARVRGDLPSFFQPPNYAKNLVDQFIESEVENSHFVTITSREINRFNVNNTRQINKEIWSEALKDIKKMGVTPILIRDTAMAFDEQMFAGVLEAREASIHLPFRAALYEKAILNFSKVNGPAIIQLFGKGNLKLFASFDKDSQVVSEKWYEANFGMGYGSQFPMTTDRIDYFWGPEDRDVICKSINEKIQHPKQETKLNGFSGNLNILHSFKTSLLHFVKCVQKDVMQEDADLISSILKINKENSLVTQLEDTIKNLEGTSIPTNTIKSLRNQFGLKL